MLGDGEKKLCTDYHSDTAVPVDVDVSTGVADCAVAAAGRGRQELTLLFARL
jgi:hypothetical protein